MNRFILLAIAICLVGCETATVNYKSTELSPKEFLYQNQEYVMLVDGKHVFTKFCNDRDIWRKTKKHSIINFCKLLADKGSITTDISEYAKTDDISVNEIMLTRSWQHTGISNYYVRLKPACI